MCLRVSVVFSSLLSLKYITYSFFCLSALSLFPPCCRVSSVHPCPSLLLPSLPSLRLSSACPPLLLPAVCLLLCPVVSPSVSPSPWLVPSGLLCARPRSSPAAFCVSCRLSVTRQPSGAKRCGSVGRCTVCMSPALSVPPLAYVLPLLVPWLVLLPAVRPCACPAAVCRLVVTIAYTPLCQGRRRFGAASVM